MIKRCQNESCGVAFTPARRDAKFCSERCRGQANARRARASLAVVTPAPSIDRLAAMEARLDTFARGLELRLDAIERSVAAARAETSQALKVATEGRGREVAMRSVRGLAERLDTIDKTITSMRTQRGTDAAQQETDERLTALEEMQGQLVAAVNSQHEQLRQLDRVLADLVEPPVEPRRRR